ncbi:MAG: hypothetical protein J4473_02200 [Candidatus Aenigmarchaeota archaeon]|nr:hypothetical protein [Candidatus Aenigmarchaeota archaeon]
MERIFRNEFIEKTESGQKSFNNTEIDYADLGGRVFQDIKIKDSWILFTSSV